MDICLIFEIKTLGAACEEELIVRRDSHIAGEKATWDSEVDARNNFTDDGQFRSSFLEYESALFSIAEWLYGGREQVKIAYKFRFFVCLPPFVDLINHRSYPHTSYFLEQQFCRK